MILFGYEVAFKFECFATKLWTPSFRYRLTLLLPACFHSFRVFTIDYAIHVYIRNLVVLLVLDYDDPILKAAPINDTETHSSSLTLAGCVCPFYDLRSLLNYAAI